MKHLNLFPSTKNALKIVQRLRDWMEIRTGNWQKYPIFSGFVPNCFHPGSCTMSRTPGPKAKLVTYSPHLQWPWAAGGPHGPLRDRGRVFHQKQSETTQPRARRLQALQVLEGKTPDLDDHTPGLPQGPCTSLHLSNGASCAAHARKTPVDCRCPSHGLFHSFQRETLDLGSAQPASFLTWKC